MVAGLEVLAVIPVHCRPDGSSSQYMKLLAGHPCIAYSLAAATQAETVTQVFVATSDAKVADVARDYHSEPPFLLPAELTQSEVDDRFLLRFVLDRLADQQSYQPQVIVKLPPDTPLRPRGWVDQAVLLLLDQPGAAKMVSVVPLGQSLCDLWQPNGEGKLVQLPDRVSPPVPVPLANPTIYQKSDHLEVMRADLVTGDASQVKQPTQALILEASYAIRIDRPLGWQWAEWVVQRAELDIVYPGFKPRPLPERVALLVLDFDGVLTDNQVWVDEAGREQVSANRSDGLGLSYLRQAGIDALVLSKETNPVVAARCRKMNLPFIQGIDDKPAVLRSLLDERHVDPSQVVYLGNDINDVPCFPLVGCAVVVADAEPGACRRADLVLSRPGGNGAVRELCDLLLGRLSK